MKTTYYLAAAVGVLATAVACSDKSPSPAAPTPAPAAVDGAGAAADGSTLKVTAPTPVSPANGSTLGDFDVTLQITASTWKFAPPEPLAYRFEVLRGGNVVDSFRGANALSWKPQAALESNTEYGWRARAEQGTAVGPWSPTWTFRTPDQPPGYNVAGELYDPLYTGETIGNINGSAAFVPGQGLRLNGFTSHVEYVLPQTIASGEISLMVTNVETNTEGSKTKIMSMREGRSDITTNDRRFTIEKRGNPPGIIAWRLISHRDQIDTVGAQRVKREFNPNRWYLWTASWRSNRFNLTIREDNANGRVIYSFGKPYNGAYDPSPHLAYIGAPVGRGGSSDATVPGMVAKQLWISNRPRPAFANK
jgi:hypothetical protein